MGSAASKQTEAVAEYHYDDQNLLIIQQVDLNINIQKKENKNHLNCRVILSPCPPEPVLLKVEVKTSGNLKCVITCNGKVNSRSIKCNNTDTFCLRCSGHGTAMIAVQPGSTRQIKMREPFTKSIIVTDGDWKEDTNESFWAVAQEDRRRRKITGFDPYEHLKDEPTIIFENCVLVKDRERTREIPMTLQFTSTKIIGNAKSEKKSFEMEWENVQTSYLLSQDIVVIVDVDWNERHFTTDQGAGVRDLIKVRVHKYMTAAKHVLYRKFLSRDSTKRKSRDRKALQRTRGRRNRSVVNGQKETEIVWEGKDDLISHIDALLLDESTDEGQYKAELLNRLSQSRQDALDLCKAIRERLDHLKQYILNAHQDEFRSFLTIPLGKTELDLEGFICKCIEDSIQRLLLTPIIGPLTARVKSKTQDELVSLKYKLFFLRGKGQKFFDIPKKNQSRRGFVKSSLELRRLQNTPLPNEKMHVLLNCARLMHKEKPMLAGDDILPITIYVIVKSCQDENDNPVIQPSDIHLMSVLADPDLGLGEYGYYLTVFSAAVEWIQSYDPNKIEKMQKTMEALKNLGF